MIDLSVETLLDAMISSGWYCDITAYKNILGAIKKAETKIE
jgi:hypothetical protein